MGRRYDIIQTPKDINHSDIPEEITLSKPFMIEDKLYVCEKTEIDSLKIYKGSEQCGVNKNYYVIRKL